MRVLYDTHGYSPQDGMFATVVQVGYRWGRDPKPRRSLIVVRLDGAANNVVTENSNLTPLCERPGLCAHPGVSDVAIRDDLAHPERDSLKCPDCGEYLYPHEGEVVTVHVGEPVGAGDDYWGRPSHRESPEHWSE
jgi:hypothetical protein